MILFEKKNKYGSFNDLMDVSIETGDKWLDKKLNVNICYGKGGGSPAPQDVPRTLRPYVTGVSGAQLAQAGQTLGGVTQDIGRFRAGIGSAQQQALQAAEASRAGAGRANINELDIGRYVDPYQQQVIDIEKTSSIKEKEF